MSIDCIYQGYKLLLQASTEITKWNR